MSLLSRVLHRDLSTESYKTNAHLHHHVAPPQGYMPYTDQDDKTKIGDVENVMPVLNSFFNYAPSSSASFPPKDPQTHGSLKASRLVTKKLRWLTIGGQYDWTAKAYADEVAAPFPNDIAQLLQGLFPDTKAQAAILNFYSPGDTLSLHRDVSEESDKGLVSISLGCDGLFVVGLEDMDHRSGSPSELGGEAEDADCHVLRLHSGDVLYMSGKARFAWHGVPKIITGTCPEWMRDWPAESQLSSQLESDFTADGQYEEWRGWMAGKRINLNVRQMFT